MAETLAPQSDNVLVLVGRQKAEFNYAARMRSWLLRVQAALGLISIITVFLIDDRLLYAAAVPAIVLIALWFFLNARMGASRSHAERLRRATLIMGGLGILIEGDEMFELSSGGFASDSEARRLVDPDYFASKEPPGASRMSQWLEESATWTTTLAEIAARETWTLFGVAAVISLVVLFASSLFLHVEQWERAARIFFSVLTVLLSADFLGSALAYQASSRESRRILNRVKRNRESGLPTEMLMVIASDYNSVSESLPLFPRGLYDRHKDRLNQTYNLYLTGAQ